MSDRAVRAQALMAQHKRRMAHMPWLYFSAPPHVRAWAEQWQHEVHEKLSALEALALDPECFIAEEANLFAEPHREVIVGPRASIAAHAFVHGPVTLASEVSINPYATLEGGQGGIVVGAGTRVATRASLFAFEHGMAPERPLRTQRVRSRGIGVGEDVWIGTGATITDGVRIGDRAVIGAGAVVTREVAEFAIMGGVPARQIGDRRTWGGAV